MLIPGSNKYLSANHAWVITAGSEASSFVINITITMTFKLAHDIYKVSSLKLKLLRPITWIRLRKDKGFVSAPNS